MKKGFTLIELLAVIVILAIIALIAIPQLTNVINNVKVSALKSSADGLYESARLYSMKNDISDNVRFDIEDNEIITTEQDKLNYKGYVKRGAVVITKEGNISICVTDGKNSAYKSIEDSDAKTILNKVCSIEKNSTDVVLNGLEKTDYVFDNVSLMKKANVKIGKTIYTRGYYSSNDGGSAYYEVIDNNSKSNDNGYILLDNGLMAKYVVKDKVNVKSLGAKGDGVTDDTQAINNALSRRLDGIIYFPKGTYMVSSQLTILNHSIIKGEGKDSIVKAMDNYKIGSNMFYMNKVNDVLLKNISISGNSLANTLEEGYNDNDGIHPLDIWESNNITIDNVNIIDNMYVALRIIKDSSKIKIINSKFLNVDCGVIILGSGNVDDLLIENNYFDGHKNSEPISLFGTGVYTNIVVNKNIIKNKTFGHAIIFGTRGAKTKDSKVTNNIINDVAVGIRIVDADNIEVANNSINNVNTLDLKKGGIGINVTDSKNMNIHDNTIEKTVQAGLYLNNLENAKVYNNTIKDAGNLNNDWYFVDIRGVNSNVEFYNNTLNREDNSLYSYLMNVHGDGGVTIKDNTFKNGKLMLWTDSSNIVVSNNNVEVNNRGTNNVITN